MDVEVVDGLAGDSAGIEPDVEAVRVMEFGNSCANRVHEFEYVGPFLWRGLPPGAQWASGDHQGVACGYRKCVPNCEC